MVLVIWDSFDDVIFELTLRSSATVNLQAHPLWSFLHRWWIDFWTIMLTLFWIKRLDIRVAETLLLVSSSFFVERFSLWKIDLLCERVVCVSMWHGMTWFNWNRVELSPSLYFPEIQQLAIKIENEYGFVIHSARTDYPPVLWKPTCDQVETPFNGRLSLTGISSL